MFHRNLTYPARHSKGKSVGVSASSIDLLKGLYVLQLGCVRLHALYSSRVRHDLAEETVRKKESVYAGGLDHLRNRGVRVEEHLPDVLLGSASRQQQQLPHRRKSRSLL
jgi:hypothetical protein